MKTYQCAPVTKIWLTVLLFLTLLSSMATPAAALPFNIMIGNPGVWSITGSFDSNTGIWDSPSDIMNWTFTAEAIGGPPKFTVGPLKDGIGLLGTFMGNPGAGLQDGIQDLNVLIPKDDGPSITYQVFDVLHYSVEFNNFKNTFRASGLVGDIINQVSVEGADPIPEPSTAIMMLTGLAGLAGYRWQKARWPAK